METPFKFPNLLENPEHEARALEVNDGLCDIESVDGGRFQNTSFVYRDYRYVHMFTDTAIRRLAFDYAGECVYRR